MRRIAVVFLALLFAGNAVAAGRAMRNNTNDGTTTARDTQEVRERSVNTDKTAPVVRSAVSRAAISDTATVGRSITTRTSTADSAAVRSIVSRIPASRVSVERSITPRTNVSFGAGNSGTNVVARTTSAESFIQNRESLADLNEFCINKYTECMDNFCNVLDETQGRCSCSENLDKYAKTQTALTQANESLQDVAQKIRYIGLTSEEIDALFSETAAESVMLTSRDSTQLTQDLNKIKNMVVDIKPVNTTTQSNTGIDLSGILDLSVSGTIFDVSSIGQQVKSVSNQRGKALYDTATARCKASVLDECTALGVDATTVKNAYDMEIAKQCSIYERNLEESNNQLVSTVRSAENVLQRARLFVARQKNAYDLPRCISELDSCMQDDFVCGDNYVQCLDPTGKYIVNGEVVVGAVFKDGFASADTDEISKYLKNKIGTLDDDGKPKGLCADVLSKCQNYVMGDDRYIVDNTLIENYLRSVLPSIEKHRAEIVSDYAVSCIADVTSCLNDNIGNTLIGIPSNASIRACLQSINTCRSLTDPNPSNDFADIQDWVATILEETVDIPVTGPVSPETDMKNCQAVGGTVSATGSICIVKNVQSVSQLSSKTIRYGWAPYNYFTSSSVEVNMGSAIIGKKIPANTYLYVMQSAYLTALQKCESLGGTLSISVGKEYNNAYIYCTIESTDGQMTQEKCDSLLNVWPQASGDIKTGGFSDNGTSQVCKYMPAGLYYIGKDFGGDCLPDMVENQSTGNCTCKPGWCYETAYSCTENCSN